MTQESSNKVRWHEFVEPKFLVALFALFLFGWAYNNNTNDEVMKGAIIGGFNLAMGFYLGGALSQRVKVSNTEAEPLPVKETPKDG